MNDNIDFSVLNIQTSTTQNGPVRKELVSFREETMHF